MYRDVSIVYPRSRLAPILETLTYLLLELIPDNCDNRRSVRDSQRATSQPDRLSNLPGGHLTICMPWACHRFSIEKVRTNLISVRSRLLLFLHSATC